MKRNWLGVSGRLRWPLGLSLATLLLAVAVWRVALGAPAWLAPLRLYTDHAFLHERLRALGWLGPVAFILIQAGQVVISPIPGEARTMAAFGVGRWLGAAVVARYVSAQVIERFGFLLEAEGAVLTFVLYLIPGFPKDIVSYLLGMSPMPSWIFRVVSTLGRIPGTWILSAQGAGTATGQYIQLALLTALTAAVAIPLYYYRHAILDRIRRSVPHAKRRSSL